MAPLWALQDTVAEQLSRLQIEVLLVVYLQPWPKGTGGSEE